MSARVVLLLALLGAATAQALPSGRKWSLAACTSSCVAGTTCVNSRCVPAWRQAASIDNSGAATVNGGTVPYSTILQITQTAFAAWTSSRVSCATSWNTAYQGTFTVPVGLNAINARDNQSLVIWLSGASWTHLPNELALTTATYYTSNAEIFDSDMEFNNNIAWSTTGQAGRWDPESVILHEAGHFMGLDHTPASSIAVMYPTVLDGAQKRVLTSVDENDVCVVYPAVGGAQGASCASQTECQSGKVCEGRAGGSAKICTADCTGAGACPTGYTCQPSTSGSACLPQVGAPDMCHFCQGAQDCTAGVCLLYEGTGVTFCSSFCSESAQCPSGSTCSASGWCEPTAGTCSNQCTSNDHCPTDYTCQSGACRPVGDVGDQCTVSRYCKNCGVCTLESADSTLAFCRSCCGTTAGDTYCDGCSSTSCGAGLACTGLSTGKASVCVPGASEVGACEPCPTGQCANGLVCAGGRCRAACNPSSPGACQACFSLTTGGGACACSDEISVAGEPCGPIAGGVAACGPGLACVGSPQTLCRALCDSANPQSCPQGQVCQQQGLVDVCLPGTEGGRCAPCTAAGQCGAGLQCYLGRCYEPCNVNVGTACSSCVQTVAGGAGVCGCADQVSPENGPCGSQPDVRACSTGTRCIQGSCRAQCDPQAPFNCPLLTDCVASSGAYYCVDSASGGGEGGGGGSSSSGGGSGGGRAGGTGGGAGGGTVTSEGCGCGATATPAVLWPIVAWAVRRRRRAPR